jgi:hypothetical protein
MNPQTKALITRKEIAELLDISYDAVRKGEQRLGISQARRDLNSRCVRYCRRIVIFMFKQKGFIE